MYNKISIIIPVYQSHEIVRRQFLHFERLRKKYQFELIIVDDCSYPPIPGAMARTDNKLGWTQGLARNLGASIATGKYLFMTDIDHVISENALVDALYFGGNKMIFRRQIAVLDESGMITQDKEVLSSWGYDKENLDASVHGNTFLIKKADFEALGGYDKETCTRGFHPVSRRGDDCFFNAKWNKMFRGQQPTMGRDIYVFPLGRFNKTGDLNPFGLFHNLHHREEKQWKQ